MPRFSIRDVLWLTVVVALGMRPPPLDCTASAQEPAKRPESAAIIAKVYEKYGKVRSYHFEHTIRLHEAGAAREGVKVAEVTLVTISEKGKLPGTDIWSDAQKQKQFPLNLSRFYFAAKRKGADIVHACDGQTSWFFLGQTNEFKRGTGATTVLGPTAATMFTALHLAPLGRFVDQSLQVEQSLKDEAIEIGGERKECYVLEGTVKPQTRPKIPNERTTFPEEYNPVGMPTGIYMLFEMHGFGTAQEGRTLYLPPTGKTASVKFALWVDRRDSTVWQCRIVEKASKSAAKEPNRGDEEKLVTLELTDTFSVVKIDSAIDPGSYRFTPPADAKEVQEFTKTVPPTEEKWLRSSRQANNHALPPPHVADCAGLRSTRAGLGIFCIQGVAGLDVSHGN
jgi:hypothetical protein